MSWQVKDPTTELNRLRNDLNKIRDQLFISSFSTGSPSGFLVGGLSGQGGAIGAGTSVGLFAWQTDRNVQITDEEFDGTPTGIFDKINISTSSMIITTGGGSFDVKFIQGTLNDGQFIILKPQTGTTITLKTGGNINISSDVTVNDKELIIAIFYEEQTSPDSNGNYVIHKLSTTAGVAFYQTIQDEGSAVTQRPTFNFIGAGVTAVDNAGSNRTDITITGAGGPDTPWTVTHDANGFSLININTLKSQTGPIASIGFVQMGNNESVAWKNVGAGDNTFRNDANDNFNMTFNGVTGYEWSTTEFNLNGLNINNLFQISNLGEINDMDDLFFSAAGTAFAGVRQVFGSILGLNLNTPIGDDILLRFGGIVEWVFSNNALIGGVFSSIAINSFFLLGSQLADPFINGELRNVSGDLKAFSGGVIFDFTKANPTGMGQDVVFPGTSGFTIDFDGSNIALTATAGGQTLPSNPLFFIIVKAGGATVKIPVYSP